MMIYNFILPYADILPNINQNEIYVGIDGGVKIALANSIKLNYAIGDFDSLDNVYLDKLLDIKIIKLNPIKDETDTEYSIKYFNNKNNIIKIYGGLNNRRLDHLRANINLCYKYDNIYFIDKNNIISNIINHKSIITKDYKYCSFFLDYNSILSLCGFKYDLNNYKFNNYDNLCISNELINDNYELSYFGNGIVIVSKDDNN